MMTLTSTAPSRVDTVRMLRGDAGAATLAAAWAAVGSWALAAVYFVNGLTRPDAKAWVNVTSPSLDLDIPHGWVEESGAQVLLHTAGATAYADRLALRLDLVAALMVVGVGLLGVAYVLSTRKSVATGRGWWLIAAAMVSAGTVVPVATWLQASTVVDLAGNPDGLAAPADINGYWILGGLLCAVLARRSSTERHESVMGFSVH